MAPEDKNKPGEHNSHPIISHSFPEKPESASAIHPTDPVSNTAEPLPPQAPSQPAPAYTQPQPPHVTPQQQFNAAPPVSPPAPVAPAAPANSDNTSGVLVLQWLTYAFWGWTVLAMSILTVTVLSNIIADADTSDFTPYGVAAVLVLLPIAAICDFLYSKHEPQKKTGAASLIMIIHAVIFALFGIGTLIWAVFALISLFTSSSDNSGSRVGLYSTIIIFILYGAAFLRTLNPMRIPNIRRIYMIFMLISVGIIALMAILGPVANAHRTKDDKLIESSLSGVEEGISDYAKSNKTLPDSLSDVNYQGDAKKLVDSNLVEYKPNTRPVSKPTSYTGANTSRVAISQDTTYYYQLCVTYKEASKSRYSSYNSTSSEYSSYVSTYNHPAGRTCYNIKSVSYSYEN